MSGESLPYGSDDSSIFGHPAPEPTPAEKVMGETRWTHIPLPANFPAFEIHPPTLRAKMGQVLEQPMKALHHVPDMPITVAVGTILATGVANLLKGFF